MKNPSLNNHMLMMSVDEYMQNTASNSCNPQLIISIINKFIDQLAVAGV
jgi:hypothetical protein